MTDEVLALRESIATLESQLGQAEGKAIILEAQLGGHTAACAAQVLAARAYLDATADIAHDSRQQTARQDLWRAIDSNAGVETQDIVSLRLLATLARLRTALAWYGDHANYDAFDSPGTLDPQEGTWHVDGGARARAALRQAQDSTLEGRT